MSLFIYAYTLADSVHDLEELVGVETRNLFRVSCGRVSAIVSAYEADSLSLSGKDIFAHQHVQRKLMEEATIIPLQYGLTLSSLAKVEAVLSSNEASLHEKLVRLYRKVEMEVTLRFDVPDLLDYLIERYPKMRDEKAKVVQGRLLYYMGDRAKKGERFQTTLRKEKKLLARKAEEIIGPWCAEIEASRLPLAECDVVTFNCLVNRERLKVFEKSIYDAGAKFGADFRFTFNGPWAPQNFYESSEIAYS